MPSYEILVEEANGQALLHCRVHEWKLSTYKAIIKDVAQLKTKYDRLITVTPNVKFAEMFGAHPTGKSVSYAGKTYEVMSWD